MGGVWVPVRVKISCVYAYTAILSTEIVMALHDCRRLLPVPAYVALVRPRVDALLLLYAGTEQILGEMCHDRDGAHHQERDEREDDGSLERLAHGIPLWVGRVTGLYSTLPLRRGSVKFF